jgi:hypothetical protein
VSEWRQFRLLWRDALRKLLNAVILGRDIDPVAFAISITAIVMTPPSMFAFGQMVRYGQLAIQPVDVIESVVIGHRMFFVFYSMVASALLAAMTWEALFPDRLDQEVIGVLPVRPRTLAAARLAAGLCMAAVFAGAVNLPSAVLFAIASVNHPALGFFPTVLAAHAIATIAGSLAVFVVLLLVRGVVAFLAGADTADRLATVLQLVAIVALIEVFFYLPSVIPLLVRRMLEGGEAALWMPPAWFAAMYTVIVGTSREALSWQALLGAAVLVGGCSAVVPIYLLPARIMARRALESQSRQRPGPVSTALRALGRLSPRPASRAIAEFAITSLGRNRRHVLIVVSYAGVGIAIAAIAIIAARIRIGLVSPAPSTSLLAVPLVMMFFVTLGLRAAFRIPTDLDANWSIRITPPTTEEAGAGTLVALFALAVAPITAIAALAALGAGWPLATVTAVVAFDLATGLVLLEAALIGWTIVPFACAYQPGQDSARYRWLIYLVPLNVFAFRGAGFQVMALE